MKQRSHERPSTETATCLLIMSGFEPTIAFQRISAARGLEVLETAEQLAWVVQFAEELATLANQG